MLAEATAVKRTSFDRVVEILRAESRTEGMVGELENYFETNKFFADLIKSAGIDSFHLCLKRMRYEKAEKGDTVMTYGEYGDKFYIILKGRLSIIVPLSFTKELTLYELFSLVIGRYHDFRHDKNTDFLKMFTEVAWLFPDFLKHNKVNNKFKLLKD